MCTIINRLRVYFMMSLKKTLFLLILLISLNSFGGPRAKKLLPSLLKKNNFVMIRHSIAPGMGDPDFFKLRDCKTQRNLSKEGREQSVKIGNLFKKHKLIKANMYSSQWCRCLETAKLMNLGEVKELPFLNSFFRNFEKEEYYISGLKKWLIKNKGKRPLVLVTHQVTITGLTNYFPASGEIVFVNIDSQNKLKVYGTLKTR